MCGSGKTLEELKDECQRRQMRVNAAFREHRHAVAVLQAVKQEMFSVEWGVWPGDVIRIVDGDNCPRGEGIFVEWRGDASGLDIRKIKKDGTPYKDPQWARIPHDWTIVVLKRAGGEENVE